MIKKYIKKLFNLLDKNNLKISSVESFTGGLFASLITSVPGSSKYFMGSIVSYNTIIKEELVKVDSNIIKEKTVVSKEVADEMALKGKNLLKSDICVSFTGNAGPTVCEGDKEVGLTFVSIAYKDKLYSFKFLLKFSRNKIRYYCVKQAILKLIEILEKK